MVTDLLKDLAEVARLSSFATNGKWSVEPEGKNEFGQPEFTIEIYNGKCPIVGAGAFWGDSHDADIAAGAVNFIRTHAAEIEADKRDARRYRWLRDKRLQLWYDANTNEPAGCDFDFTGSSHDVDACIDAMRSAKDDSDD